MKVRKVYFPENQKILQSIDFFPSLFAYIFNLSLFDDFKYEIMSQLYSWTIS